MRYAALILILFAGCHAARMPVPDALTASEHWSVAGRQGLKIRQELRFGPYAVQNVKRSWTRGRDVQVQAFERNERHQNFSFVLREAAADQWFVKCETALDAGTIETPILDVNVRNRSRLTCALSRAGDSRETWQMELTEKHDRPLEGTIRNGSSELVVRGTNKLQKSLPMGRTSGYYLLEGEHTIAAVEVLNSGSVIVNRDAAPERRSLISAAAGALLLVEDLREQVEAARS